MKIFIMILFLMLSTFAISQTPGFGVGENLTYAYLNGDVSVSCFGLGPIDHAFYRCQGIDFNPATYSYFYGPEGASAEKVNLIATWEDGKVVKKTRKYDSKKGRTKNKINLGNSSLTQRPLLGVGQNMIAYKLLNGGDIVSEGQIIVNLEKLESRTCQDGHITSYNSSDCTNSYRVCEEYFRMYDDCR